jgi:proteasome lid subunit RPN8/RPN11
MMTTSVHAEILERLASRETEAGGALVGPRNHPIVTHFFFDEGAAVSSTSYTPDHAALNARLPRLREVNLEMKGLVHSHPPGVCLPSAGDVAYVRSAFANTKNRVEQYLLPIVCDGRLHPHVFTREDIVERAANDITARIRSAARLVLV